MGGMGIGQREVLMARNWIGGLLGMLALGACATEPAAPVVPPTPQAQQEAGDQAVAGLITRDARPGPRNTWRRVTVDNPDVANAYVDRRPPMADADWRRAWLIMNFRDSMPIPETGGRALSVAMVGDYRCAAREWRSIESIWFRRRDAQQLEWRAPSRNPTWRPVQAGTATELFLNTACNDAAPARGRATRTRGSQQ